jgi:orotate phosphoribosyltransferase
LSMDANDDDDLARAIGELCHLTGEFKLRSGRVETTYFDKYLFEADPTLLRSIASRLVTLVPPTTEVLAGIELGGIPVVTALGLATGLPVCFVRKKAKTYGTEKLAEGADVAGKHVLAVEDVITTGGQVAESVAELRALGAQVSAVLCVIDRSGGDHPPLTSSGIELLSLFRSDDVAPA